MTKDKRSRSSERHHLKRKKALQRRKAKRLVSLPSPGLVSFMRALENMMELLHDAISIDRR